MKNLYSFRLERHRVALVGADFIGEIRHSFGEFGKPPHINLKQVATKEQYKCLLSRTKSAGPGHISAESSTLYFKILFEHHLAS